MKTLDLNKLENIQGGGWFGNTLDFFSGACLGLGVLELAAISVIPTGYGQAVAGACIVIGVGAMLT